MSSMIQGMERISFDTLSKNVADVPLVKAIRKVWDTFKPADDWHEDDDLMNDFLCELVTIGCIRHGDVAFAKMLLADTFTVEDVEQMIDELPAHWWVEYTPRTDAEIAAIYAEWDKATAALF